MAQPSAKMVWYGGAYGDRFAKEWERRLHMAAAHVQAKIQINLSLPSRSGRSKPGEYPHAETGRLRNSIFYEVDGPKMEAIIGTPLLYGLWLENGTRGGKIIHARNGGVLSWIGDDGTRMFSKTVRLGAIEPRPYLKRTLKEEEPAIRKMFEGVVPDGKLTVT